MSTDDIAGFASAAGILTATAGRTADAAVVARQMGKTCLVGCRVLRVDVALREARLAGRVIVEGDWISLDGATGSFLGRRETISERPAAELTETANGVRNHFSVAYGAVTLSRTRETRVSHNFKRPRLRPVHLARTMSTVPRARRSAGLGRRRDFGGRMGIGFPCRSAATIGPKWFTQRRMVS